LLLASPLHSCNSRTRLTHITEEQMPTVQILLTTGLSSGLFLLPKKDTGYNFVGPTFAVTPAGQELCYIDTGTTPIQNYNITYVQQ
jgi:hypothetical protein